MELPAVRFRETRIRAPRGTQWLWAVAALLLCGAQKLAADDAATAIDSVPNRVRPAEAESPVISSARVNASAGEFVSEDRLKRHVGFLASDALRGRAAGSDESRAAAAYIEQHLSRRSIAPLLPSGYRQDFSGQYANVLAKRPGNDATRAGEVILVGAHYDHVGLGTQRTSRGPLGQIHNGADDNASGTAALLELAEILHDPSVSLSRSIVFAFWDAEEIGLLGSEHFAGEPTLPLESIRLVINLDMVGRLSDDKLMCEGYRTLAGLRQFIAAANTSSRLRVEFDREIRSDTDHWPFIKRRVPAVQFDTGKHADYHRPTDDADRIQFAGLKRITQFAAALVEQSANIPEIGRFRPESRDEAKSKRSQEVAPVPSRLGVRWDQERAREGGLRVTSIVVGSPAAKAGLAPGDLMIGLQSRGIKAWDRGSADDFRTSVLLAGAETVLQIERGAAREPAAMDVTLSGPPIEFGADCEIDPAHNSGVVVRRVVPWSVAARAGLIAGDWIGHVNDVPVMTPANVCEFINDGPDPAIIIIESNGLLDKREIPLFRRR